MSEITVPRLGWSMDEGVFAGWLKAEGDRVAPGEPLFMIETDKAVQEVESLDGGVLRLAPDAPAVGATVAVGRAIGYLVRPGETLPARAGAAVSSASWKPASLPVPAPEGAPRAGARRRATPRARRLARALGIDLARVSGSGRDGRILERDVKEVAP